MPARAARAVRAARTGAAGALAVALGLLATVSSAAPPPTRPDLSRALDAGWQEAVISVRDPAPMLRFAETVAGWRVIYRGALPDSALGFYLPDGRRPISSARRAREWLIGDATATPGLIRLIAFDDARAVEIRGGSMPWDVGGLLSLMTRSNATDDVYRAAQALGWSAFNDPVELNLADSGVKLTNVVLRGPDGVNVAIYERLSPRMPDDADLRRLRRPFNSMQVVRDIERARAFYGGVLGFEILNAGLFANPVRAPNNFGVPGNLVVAHPLPFTILGPRRDGPTQIELIQFPGVEGRDLTPRAVPPNYGLFALRFPVSALARIETALRNANWPVARPPTVVDLPPYGRVRMLAVQAPDGAWLEFFEVASPSR